MSGGRGAERVGALEGDELGLRAPPPAQRLLGPQVKASASRSPCGSRLTPHVGSRLLWQDAAPGGGPSSGYAPAHVTFRLRRAVGLPRHRRNHCQNQEKRPYSSAGAWSSGGGESRHFFCDSAGPFRCWVARREARTTSAGPNGLREYQTSQRRNVRWVGGGVCSAARSEVTPRPPPSRETECATVRAIRTK